MFTHKELIERWSDISRWDLPPFQVAEHVRSKDFVFWDEGTGYISAFHGEKRWFESGLHFWIATLQVVNGYDVEGGLCVPRSQDEFAKLVGDHSSSLRKLSGFLLDLNGFVAGLKMYDDWNEFGAVAELPEVFVAFYWMTNA